MREAGEFSQYQTQVRDVASLSNASLRCRCQSLCSGSPPSCSPHPSLEPLSPQSLPFHCQGQRLTPPPSQQVTRGEIRLGRKMMRVGRLRGALLAACLASCLSNEERTLETPSGAKRSESRNKISALSLPRNDSAHDHMTEWREGMPRILWHALLSRGLNKSHCRRSNDLAPKAQRDLGLR